MSSFMKSHLVRFGIPFLLFMTGSTQVLSYVIGGRYELRDQVEKQNKLLVATDQVSLPQRSSVLTPQDVAAAEAAANASRDYDIVPMPRYD